MTSDAENSSLAGGRGPVEGWFLASLVAAVVAAPRAFAPVAVVDPGWHVAIGRLVLSSGIPFRNVLSWTHPDHPWYPTSWLYDVACALLDRAGGVFALQLFHFLVYALTFALVAIAGRAVAPRGGAWVAVLAALLLSPRIVPRPEACSTAALAAVVALGFVARRREAPRLRMAAVAVVAFTSNLHAGAMFASGALGLFCLEAALRGGAWRRELAIAAAGVLALMANPGLTYNLWYMFEHATSPEVARLGEFAAPTLVRAPTFFATGALALVVAVVERRRAPVMLALVVVFFLGGLRALRLVYNFEIVAAPVLAAGLARLSERWAKALPLAMGGALVALVLARADLYRQTRFGAEFDMTTLPVRAAEVVRALDPKGPGYNSFGDGGYLEYALPGRPTFIDPRVQAYPPKFFAELVAAEASPEAFQRDLRARGVTWALTASEEAPLTGARRLDSPDWALVYWDDANELYLRRDVPENAAAIERFEYRHLRPYGRIIGAVAEASRAELPEWLAEIDRYRTTSPEDPRGAIVNCAARRREGDGSAEAACAEAARLVAGSRIPAHAQLLDRARHLPAGG